MQLYTLDVRVLFTAALVKVDGMYYIKYFPVIDCSAWMICAGVPANATSDNVQEWLFCIFTCFFPLSLNQIIHHQRDDHDEDSCQLQPTDFNALEGTDRDCRNRNDVHK